MTENYFNQIMSLFKNVTLNAIGAERDLYTLLQDKDVGRAIGLMQDRDREVDEAISEYYPEKHKVNSRPNKIRENEPPYISEKLPRTRQRYINEVELFFLLGKPIEWKKEGGDDEVFALYKDFIRDHRINARLREAKRLAGAETESALIFDISGERHDDGSAEIKVIPFVAARSKGYTLRPMFDQFGQLVAFAYGYKLRLSGKTVLHWHVETARLIFECRKGKLGWEVETRPNPTGKINVVYFKQEKAWAGVQPRIEREEEVDSKMADTNNYFADPMAAATADVINELSTPDKPGRLIQLTTQQSKFEYINPPQNSAVRESEREGLSDSILFDTMTPDFHFEKMRGLGGVSGVAIKNAMIIGYIKRDNRIEIYGEMADRLRSVIVGILVYTHSAKEKQLKELKIGHEFAEPFDSDKMQFWTTIGTLYGQGVMSLETAVQILAFTNAPQEEIDRIRLFEMEKEFVAAEAQAEAQLEKEQPKEEEE